MMIEELYKIILIGDSGVGKTNLMSRFTNDVFNLDAPSTIGVEFMSKRIDLGNATEVKLQVWDTAGQERFRAMSRGVYYGSHGVFLTYDITSRESFDHLANWLKDIRVQVTQNTVIFLVGNKSDLDHMRVIQQKDGVAFAKDNGLLFMETSALEKLNVDEAFLFLAQSIREKFSSASPLSARPSQDGTPKPIRLAAPSTPATTTTSSTKDATSGSGSTTTQSTPTPRETPASKKKNSSCEC